MNKKHFKRHWNRFKKIINDIDKGEDIAYLTYEPLKKYITIRYISLDEIENLNAGKKFITSNTEIYPIFPYKKNKKEIK